MIPRGAIYHLHAPDPKILGVPEVMSEVLKSGLYVPPSYRTHTRSSVVRILDDSVGAYKPGWRVLLAATAGRRFYVGVTAAEEIEVVLFGREAILLILDHETAVGDQKQSFLRNFDGREPIHDEDDQAWDEGDPEGLR